MCLRGGRPGSRARCACWRPGSEERCPARVEGGSARLPLVLCFLPLPGPHYGESSTRPSAPSRSPAVVHCARLGGLACQDLASSSDEGDVRVRLFRGAGPGGGVLARAVQMAAARRCSSKRARPSPAAQGPWSSLLCPRGPSSPPAVC